MAEEDGGDKGKEKLPKSSTDVSSPQAAKDSSAIAPTDSVSNTQEDAVRSSDGEDEDEDEDAEPRLKYTKLTGHLGQAFKGKDSISASLSSGDKFIVGTHNGNVHVYALPTLELLRSYNAHSASITSISVSPFSPSISSTPGPQDFQAASDQEQGRPSTPARTPTASSIRSVSNVSPNVKRPRPTPSGLPHTPSNLIHIGTSSIDGHVCVSSLTDPADVTLRNFSRPVQAIALSPDFKTSRSYLSGGLSGQLIYTTGGKQGGREDANTINSAAAASAWLGQIGLGGSTGRDVIRHQGEGPISAIRWSLSGRFVAWVNETGIKIMRSPIGLGTEDQEIVWKRIGHVDKPRRTVWEDNSAVWKAKVQWMDDRYLEKDEVAKTEPNGVAKAEKRTEKLLVGWGDAVWLLHVFGEGSAPRSRGEKGFKTPDIVHHKQSEELDSDVLSKLDRYQSLSFTDYHLTTIFFSTKKSSAADSRSSLGVFGDGLWDVSKNATRLFSSGASVMSSSSSDVASDRRSTTTSQATTVVSPALSSGSSLSRGLPPSFTKPGLKIFIVSPFDALLSVKRDGSDHLAWLKEQEKYEQAWTFVDQHPEVVVPQQVSPHSQSRPGTPSRAQETLAEFLDDDSSSTSSAMTIRAKSRLPAVAREKRVIGDMWVQRLVDAEKWESAGHVAGQVVDLPEKWERWIATFTEANRLDEISSHVPSKRMKPAISPACYEGILEHYIEHDCARLQALVNNWSTELFNIDHITEMIQTKLESVNSARTKSASSESSDNRDWRVLQDCLAHLYLASNCPADALHCYLLTRNADPAIDLIKEHHLFSSISDIVYEFANIRVTPQQSTHASLSEIDSISSDSITLLATATFQNIISVSSAISQFQQHSPEADRFLFFYIRALWTGAITITADESIETHRSRRSRFAPTLSTNPTRHLLASYGDLAVTVFASYEPSLLSELLRARDLVDDPAAGGSIPYSFEHASAVCETHQLTAELVYLLAATGQTKEALRRICEGEGQPPVSPPTPTHNDSGIDDDPESRRVEWAIHFCTEHADPSLWNELLSFSLSRPLFLRGLLYHVSLTSQAARKDGETGIDPVELVKSIPEGMKIPGLKAALERLVKDADVQRSIALGAKEVLRGEVLDVMERVISARKKGIPFEVEDTSSMAPKLGAADESKAPEASQRTGTKPVCAICDEVYTQSTAGADSHSSEEKQDFLIAHPCGHVLHLSCVLSAISDSSNRRQIADLEQRLEKAASDLQEPSDIAKRGRAGGKVSRMQMIGRVLRGRGCVRCEWERKKKDVG
ncbi:MAG: hypothetical protein Q9162_005769 [Coniocarpon cinnabarinum]